jgi:toxin-antitoxin system PIN domain toxin
VKLLDVNLLLYAYDEGSPLHDRAKRWLTRQFNAPERTGLAMQTVLAFVRLTTNARIFEQPLLIDEACTIVSDWLARPSVLLLEPTDRHWSLFVELATSSQSRGPLVPDADLAATAIEHGATLCTHDRDFARFEGLRLEYPLVA